MCSRFRVLIFVSRAPPAARRVFISFLRSVEEATEGEGGGWGE